MDDFDALRVASADNRLAVDVRDIEGAAAAQDRGQTVIGDVKVQGSVAIHIGQSHRGAAQFGDQPRRGGDIGKMTVAVIQKAGIRPAHRCDQQIQIAVSIHVGKDRACGSLIRAGHAGGFRHICELPVSQIFVERIRSVQIAQINVAKTVAVVIPQRHARTVHQVGVGHGPFLGKRVCEVYCTDLRPQETKARFAGGGNRQRRLAKPDPLLPVQRTALGRQEAGDCSCDQPYSPDIPRSESHFGGK